MTVGSVTKDCMRKLAEIAGFSFGRKALSRTLTAIRGHIHVTETHVAAGLGKFVEYQARNVPKGLAPAFLQVSAAVR